MSEETVVAKTEIVRHPNDNRTHGFGFGTLLPVGRTVTSVVSAEASGGDGTLVVATPAVIVSDSVDAAGNEIKANEGASAKLSGGTAGKNYNVTVTVTDSAGENIAGVFPVLVRD